MAFNDKAVFTAATGYVYKADPGTPAITPAELVNFDGETYGANVHTVDLGSAPEDGTYTLTVEGESTEAIANDADATVVQAALEKLDGIGIGGVVVTGTPADGFDVAVVGDLYGFDVEVDGSAEVTVTEKQKASGWEPIGHTAADELPELGYEGGESEAKPTWQKKNLRNVSTEAPVDYVTVKAQQFDAETLELYYGKNASRVANVFGVDDPSSDGVEKAFQIVMVDGDFKIAFSAAKATVGRDESISLATDDFATLPLRATFVKHPGRHLFQWVLPEA